MVERPLLVDAFGVATVIKTCPDPPQNAAGPAGQRRHPGLTALLVWLLALPISLLLPALVDESPLTLQGDALPFVTGGALVGMGLLAARRGHAGAGVVAGLFAAWITLGMRTALHGSPFGFIDGDTVRLSAMAERYTTTWHSADGIVSAVPSEYPPLYPWLIGHVSVLVHIPAWRLLGPAGEITSSATIVAGFALWRRLLPDWVALAVTLVVFAAFPQPAKPYEVMALDVTIPWVLLTFSRHSMKRIRAIGAGLLGGTLILTYQAYMIFLLPAILVFISMGWQRTVERRRYARHFLTVIVVSLAVSWWYWWPYLAYALAHGLQMTDRYPTPLIALNPFPFLAISPVGLLTAFGLVGMVWYRRREWWASPLLVLTLSAYGYYFLGEARFIATGETAVFQYADHLITAVLAAAGALTISSALPVWSSRLTLVPSRDLMVLAITVVVLWVGISGYEEWMPGLTPLPGQTVDSTITSGYAPENSFLQALPDGSYPRYAPVIGRFSAFPTHTVVSDVDSIRGPRAAPLTLSWSETLFATQPWPGLIGVGANAAAGTEHWFSRVSFLRTLSQTTDPDAFATAAAHSPYGGIIVFILKDTNGQWDWSAYDNPTAIAFSPRQFSPRLFAVFPGLPDDTVVAVRRLAPPIAPGTSASS